MAKKDLQNVWQLLADIFREVSPIVRGCFFAGLLGGLGTAVYLITRVADDGWHYGLGRVLVVFGIGLTGAGAFLGLVVGALLDLAVQRLRRPPPPPPEKPQAWRPRRKP